LPSFQTTSISRHFVFYFPFLQSLTLAGERHNAVVLALTHGTIWKRSNNLFKPTAGVGQLIKQPPRAGGGLIQVLGTSNDQIALHTIRSCCCSLARRMCVARFPVKAISCCLRARVCQSGRQLVVTWHTGQHKSQVVRPANIRFWQELFGLIAV
jgi:hypothetical protein